MVERDEKRIKHYLENVKTFVESNTDLLIQNKTIAESMYVLY
jgi:hypothetical protein